MNKMDKEEIEYIYRYYLRLLYIDNGVMGIQESTAAIVLETNPLESRTNILAKTDGLKMTSMP